MKSDNIDSASSSLPSQIGPYKIEALLNKGGMSYLYLASHPETGQPVAIKVLSHKYTSNPEVVERFLKEAGIISMADHPNIIKMFGHGEWEGGLYIAMEYVEGISLRKYLLQHPISLKKALVIILDIAYAICHLHTHGVIHRDLKPENILVTDSGSIKVIDFGIAQLLTETGAPQEPSKPRWMGTPIYISPEQKENPEKVSFPSDIYSLGIIAYELIQGKLSHGHIHISLLPKGMQAILMKCLQTSPEDRYKDVVDFISDVTAYLNSPTAEKDRVVGDQLSEIFEEIRLLQAALNPHEPPQWPGIEIGIAISKWLQVRGIYYDFLPLDQSNYGVILAESSAKGTEGFTAAAVLRGMVRGLYLDTNKPHDLLWKLNTSIRQDSRLSIPFNVVYFTLHPAEQILRIVSCGHGCFWTVPAGGTSAELHLSKSEPLGASDIPKWEEKILPFNVGDLIIFHTAFAQPTEEGTISMENIALAIHETLSQTPQQQVENILRKVRICGTYPPLEHTEVCIAIKRT